jgi:hypothetical protein
MQRDIEASSQEQSFFEYLKSVNQMYIKNKSELYGFDFEADKSLSPNFTSNNLVESPRVNRKRRLSFSSSGKKRKRSLRKMSEVSLKDKSPRKKLSFDI